MREHATREYLTFTLGDEEYGVAILEVQEIRGQSTVTPIPNTAPHVRGVMNLRGTIIPVIDLRAKFGLPEAPSAMSIVTIVVHVGKKVVGLLVDGVSDVVKLTAADVQPPPDLAVSVDARLIDGLAMREDKLVMLLDLAEVLDQETRDTIAVG